MGVQLLNDFLILDSPRLEWTGVFFGSDGYSVAGFGNKAIGGDAFQKENVTSDDGVMTQHSFPSEDGGIGVDNDIVLDGWMALYVFDGIAVFVERETFRTQCDTLVDFDTFSDFCRFADDHAGSVVNEEAAIDGGSGVDVDSRLGMSPFIHNTRDDWHIESVQFMGDTMGGDCQHAGVRQLDFGVAECRRVAVVGGFYIVD